jgi:hypothetical protein
MYTILNNEFDVDQLKDIVNHGMSGGVGGFIYTASNVAIFDDNDDEIQDYLSDWCHDNSVGASSFAYFGKDIEDIAQLKSALVWAYVELKADEILAHNGYEY